MEDDAPKTNNSDDNADINIGDEPEFSTSEKVFDITSDLNIKPVNDLTAAEEAKEKDAPIANFAEKMASQTKNARIYREGAPKKQNADNVDLPIKQKPVTSFAPEAIAKNPFLGEKDALTANVPTSNPVGDVLAVPPEIAKKYHTSSVVETKPWVKNKPLVPTPVETVPTQENKIEKVQVPVEQSTEIPQKPNMGVEKIPVQRRQINNFVRDRSYVPTDNGRNEITGSNPGKNIEDTIPANKTEVEQNRTGNLRTMRTYESDVAELLSKNKTSTTTIAMAENKRSSGEDRLRNNDTGESSHAGKKLIMLLLSLIMIGAGVTGAYYLYMKSPLAPVTPITNEPKISSIVPNDKQALIAIDRLSPLEIQYKIQNEVSAPQEENTIKEIVLTETTNNIKNRVSGPKAIDAIDIDMPDVLKRSLDNAWLLGIYTDESGAKDVFVVLTNNFFQNAFAGMLQWESVMADDIKQYLLPVAPLGIANIPDIGVKIPKITNPLDNLEDILPMSIDIGTTTGSTTPSSTPKISGGSLSNSPIATTTASSTASTTEEYPAIKPYFTIRGNFEDRIVRNKDVRAFRTSDGNILFLYSFIDNQRLIITTKESTLSEVLLRIEKESFVR